MRLGWLILPFALLAGCGDGQSGAPTTPESCLIWRGACVEGERATEAPPILEIAWHRAGGQGAIAAKSVERWTIHLVARDLDVACPVPDATCSGSVIGWNIWLSWEHGAANLELAAAHEFCHVLHAQRRIFDACHSS